MILSILFSFLSFLSPESVKVNVQAVNKQQIQKIDNRDVTFGVKEEMEEILINKGYSLDDTLGFTVQVNIDSIYSPQQILNIMGTKWLRKDYIVETSVRLPSGYYKGKGVRKTFIFAMFLDVENNEVPLNKKAFSKALQESLKETSKQF